MKHENFDHGFSEEIWSAGKEVARKVMIAASSRGRQDPRRLVTYSKLVAEIKAAIPSLDLDPYDSRLNHMLCEISTEEYKAGRGMLSVVVVHAQGDKMPGEGFFQLAQKLNRDTGDREAFWIDELCKVYQQYRESNDG